MYQFLLLSSIPLYRYTKICLFTHQFSIGHFTETNHKSTGHIIYPGFISTEFTSKITRYKENNPLWGRIQHRAKLRPLSKVLDNPLDSYCKISTFKDIGTRNFKINKLIWKRIKKHFWHWNSHWNFKKNSVDWGSKSLDTDERRINKPEDRAVETDQNAIYTERISNKIKKCSRVEREDPSYMSLMNSRRKKKGKIQKYNGWEFSKTSRRQ